MVTKLNRPALIALFAVSFWHAVAAAIAAPDPQKDDAPSKPELWSLKPIQRSRPPAIANVHWARNAIDQFVLHRLEQEKLAPAPPADKRILIRRLYLDLFGLPPPPDVVRRFVNDRSPDAYERIAEQLLASPAYGERWARHWLDVVRFTESQGFEYDRIRESAWRYRDYVINSFNEDLPYDIFMREQIAGDTGPAASHRGIIATSFLVSGAWDEAGNGQANATQRAITREEEMEDMISVVGQTFLGLTVNCARCHNHKFDPIPQADYYRFKSVFDGVKHGECPIATPDEIESRNRQYASLKDRVRSLEKERREIEKEAVRGNADFQSAVSQTSGLLGVHPRNSVNLPYAHWIFSQGPNDLLERFEQKLLGTASVAKNGLTLDGKNAALITTPVRTEIVEKSITAWVSLATLDQKGGGVISIETEKGEVFDAIVYGEREDRKWMAGSEGFARTSNLDAPQENATPGEWIHVAAVYGPGPMVSFYRNGEPYGKPYSLQKALPVYRPGTAHLLLGARHTGGTKAFFNGAIAEAQLFDQALNADEIKNLFNNRGRGMTRREFVEHMDASSKERLLDIPRRIADAEAALGRVPVFPVVYSGTRVQPEPTHKLRRGDVKSPQEIVSPGGLSAIKSLTDQFDLAADSPEAVRREKFAAWLTNSRNPLPARVMANRLWQYHFGHGLVGTPNDFGNSGAQPSNAELLDWLASELRDHGWSIKRLHRLIVCSNTYRQSSEFNAAAAANDSENQLLWRFQPRRIEAETIRDSMLALSGNLNRKMGGPGFRPFEVITFNGSSYIPQDKRGPEFDRRTIYRVNVNSGKDPLLEAFDCPDPSVKTPKRGVTTTPLQALGLMNDPLVLRQAEHWAKRLEGEAPGNPKAQIELAYQSAFGRAPDRHETARAVTIQEQRGLFHLCWMLLNSTEFLNVQ